MKYLLLIIGGIVLIPLLLIYDVFAWGYTLYWGCIWLSPVIGINLHSSFHALIAIMLLVRAILPSNHHAIGEQTIVNKNDDVRYKIETDVNWIGILGMPWMTMLILWGFHFIL